MTTQRRAGLVLLLIVTLVPMSAYVVWPVFAWLLRLAIALAITGQALVN